MRFFRKKKASTPQPDPGSRESASGTGSAHSAINTSQVKTNLTIPSPGLDENDPRQRVHGMLVACGMSIAVVSRLPIEQTLEEAVQLVPMLKESSLNRGGFLRLERDEGTYWTSVDSPDGSALIAFFTPNSNSMLLVQQLMKPLDNLQPPFSRESVTQGTTDSELLVSILASGEVVPVADHPEFRHLREEGGYRLVLPASVHRAARSWDRVAQALYSTNLTRADSSEIGVYVGLLEDLGWPHVWTVLTDNGVDASYFSPLVDGSPYHLDKIDDFVMFCRRLPEQLDETTLRQLAQQLITDLEQRWERLRDGEVPDQGSSVRFWDRLETPPANATSARSGFDWSRDSEYIYSEQVRESLPDGSSTFETVEKLSHQLRSMRGSGFEYAVRDAARSLVSPSWLTVKSAAIDAESGRVVAAGHPKHEVWDLSPAFDRGAMTLFRNARYLEQGHEGGVLRTASQMYVGSTRSGTLVPLDASMNANSVDIHGATGTIALLELLGGSSGAVSMYDEYGQKRLLTVIEDALSGSEPLRFSGNGKWLLVCGSRNSMLIEVSTGRWLVLELPNCTWWPGADSMLITVAHEDGQNIPKHFSLETNSFTGAFPPITLDSPVLEAFPNAWWPEVNPDGSQMLVQTHAGVTPEYQQEFGTGSRLAKVVLGTGVGTVVTDVFLDPQSSLEADVLHARWTGRQPARAVRLHPDLAVQINDPVLEHEFLSPDRWSDEAEEILVKTLNRAIQLTKENASISHLMPEVLAALVPVSNSPEVWGRQSEWLLGLVDTVGNLVLGGQITGGQAASWKLYFAAIAAIREGKPELIDPIGAAWA